MKKRNLALLIVATVIVAAGILSGIFIGSGNAVSNSPQGQSSSSQVLFSQTSYYPFAYQIFPGSLSSTAQKAIAGFNLKTRKNSDGSTTVDLAATNPEYQTQAYTLKPGQKLYFIERSFGDDSNNEERFLGDDSAVVVDSQGYVVQ